MIIAIIVVSVAVYSNIRTRYRSKIMNQTIDLPAGAYFISENDFGDSCEISFVMFGNETDIVSKLSLSEAGFHLSSNSLYYFQEWIENDKGLYKEIMLIYYRTPTEAD